MSDTTTITTLPVVKPTGFSVADGINLAISVLPKLISATEEQINIWTASGLLTPDQAAKLISLVHKPEEQYVTEAGGQA